MAQAYFCSEMWEKALVALTLLLSKGLEPSRAPWPTCSCPPCDCHCHIVPADFPEPTPGGGDRTANCWELGLGLLLIVSHLFTAWLARFLQQRQSPSTAGSDIAPRGSPRRRGLGVIEDETRQPSSGVVHRR